MAQFPDPFEDKQQQTVEPTVEPTFKYKKEDKTAKFVSDLTRVCSTLDHLRIQAHLIHLNYEAVEECRLWLNRAACRIGAMFYLAHI